MSDPKQTRLPGFEPCAQLVLRILWMPDGKPSHYEIEGRSPGGALTHFRAQAALERFATDPAYQESRTYFEQWAMTIALELREADRIARRTEAPPTE